MTRMRLGRSAERIRSRRAGRALQGVSGRTPQPTTTAGTPHSPTSATVGFRSKPLLLLRRRQPDCTRDHAAGLILDMFLDVTVPPSPPKCYHISKTLTLWAWTHSCTDSPVAILFIFCWEKYTLNLEKMVMVSMPNMKTVQEDCGFIALYVLFEHLINIDVKLKLSYICVKMYHSEFFCAVFKNINGWQRTDKTLLYHAVTRTQCVRNG